MKAMNGERPTSIDNRMDRSHKNNGDGQMIPTIALVDRVFQQRSLLEGQSTANIALTALIVNAEESGDQGLRAATITKRDENRGDNHIKHLDYRLIHLYSELAEKSVALVEILP